MTQYTDEQCAHSLSVLATHNWATQERHLPGIQSACKRYQAKLRKRNSRASAEQRIELPLPAGTAAALRRVCEAAGDEPVALLAQQIHMLDKLREGNPSLFNWLTTHQVDVATVAARYADLIGAPASGEDDDE